MADSALKNGEVRAKLFTNGRSQAVRLPKEFRFEGKEVKISRAHGGILLQQVEPQEWTAVSVREWFAEMEAIRGGVPFPDQEEQPLAEERDSIL